MVLQLILQPTMVQRITKGNQNVRITLHCQKSWTYSLQKRLAQVQAAKLRENCPNPGYVAVGCTSQCRCMVPGCDQKYHTSLHQLTMKNVVLLNNTCCFTKDDQSAAEHVERRTKILGTALVILQAPNGS